MTAPQSLADFLLAQIAADEAAARAAGARQNGVSATEVSGVWLHSRYHMTVDPTHVLAVCAAHRRIVEACAEVLTVDGWEYDDAPDLAESTLRAIASIYAGRPGWREEWS